MIKISYTKTGKIMVMLVTINFLLPIFGSSNAYADPPPWAPAHGYRDKQYGDRDHEEDRDDERESDHRKHKHERDDEGSASRHEATKSVYVAPYGIDRGTCNREALGQVLGGVTGAAVGSTIGKGNGKTAAIIGGAIIGVIVGGSIGKSMDSVDQGCVGQALEHAPDGRRIAWDDRDGRSHYEVTPEKPFKDNEGRYCRKYLTNVVINGGSRKTYNTACRESDGSWQMIK